MAAVWKALSCVFCDFGTDQSHQDLARASREDDNLNLDPHSFHDIYTLGEVLGEGGYAIVNKAIDKRNHSEVAVKIAKRAHIDPTKESAMRREFEIMRSLSHPNIVRALGLFEEANNFYVVLEYMPGGELFDRIVEKTQYNEKEARDVVKRIVAAVEYFHLHEIVHRDLKPENLLLASKLNDIDLKVADFGLARVVDGASITGRAGTPEYWAPEVIEAKPCGKPVDMWAVGVISFVLLGGYAPFHNKDQQVMYSNIHKGLFKFHPQRWGNVSSEAKEFICSLLTVDPSKRLTASEAAAHRWLHKGEEFLLTRNLTENLEELRNFNARRKLKGGLQAVRGVQKLIRISRMAKRAGGADSDGNVSPTPGSPIPHPDSARSDSKGTHKDQGFFK